MATTAPTAGVAALSPQTVAARFAVAYLNTQSSDGVDGRRARCRPYDTDTLDAQLGAPQWAGPGPGPAVVAATTTVAVDTINAADTGPSVMGYEIAATETVTQPGQPSRTLVAALEERVERGPAGVWTVASVSGP